MEEGIKQYPHLFSGLQIKNMKLKNRLVMSPMGTFSEQRNGFPSAKQIEYYRARAKGGFGMIMLEAQYTTNKTDPWIGYITTAGTDQQMQGWSLIAEAVHSEGAKIGIQLGCGLGRNAFPFSNDQMVSASEVPSFYFPDRLCRALTVDEIHGIVDAYRTGARNAIRAEADAVEIHAHSGYILDQFMTPAWNKRTDEYGGSFENRMRLVTEVYQAIREEVGPNFPVFIRMATTHDFEGGRTIEESKEIVRYLDGLGIDAFDLDAGCYEHKQWICPSIYTGDAPMLKWVEQFKGVTDKPIFSSGMNTPELGEKALAEGKIDAVMFGRQSIADPDLPNKLLAGDREDVRPCLACNEICVGRLYQNRPISCAVNTEAVCEGDYHIEKAVEKRKVVIVGGGPGGMEAARVAALQGHDVTIYEKTDRLGGQLIAAGEPSFKQRIRNFVEWQKHQVEKLGVRVVFNKEITADSPELADADRIIVAVGAHALKLPIPGLDGENVMNVIDYHLNPSLLHGDRIIVAGAGASGCDCALELAMEGKKVTLVEMQNAIAPNMILDNRNPLTFKLEEYKVEERTSTKIKEVRKDGVVAEHDGKEEFLEADMVIDAFGMRPNSELADAIYQKYAPITSIIGDCNKVGQIAEAVRGGYFAAYSIH